MNFSWWEGTEIDHVLIEEKILHLSLLDAGSFIGADYDTDCSLVVAKLVRGLSVSE